MNSSKPAAQQGAGNCVNWGFVGTGTIAGWMADVVRGTPAARLYAVASRSLERARGFAAHHGAERTFDSWREMLDCQGIDAVYIATPTSLRENIAVAAAGAGKHVLAEKPFASLASLRRITAACRENSVCFMDATHFVHHPRHQAILKDMPGRIGQPRELESRFLISLGDRHNIRYDPSLEPLGAVGDLGWYNMRATLEYLADDVPLGKVTARLRKDKETGAVVAAKGLLTFENGATSHWRCSFESDGVDIGLALTGTHGSLSMDNFVGNDEDGAASFDVETDSQPVSAQKTVRVDSGLSGPALMFEDFAAAVADQSLRERWLNASERTQALVDQVWDVAQHD